MLYSILAAEDPQSNASNDSWMSWLLIGVVIVLIVVMLVISTRRNKKRQQEAENLINAVKPGNKVKTIGGVCGIVIEVDDEENTFVLETGSESTGKCYMKFDKQAIYQTDAVVESHDKKDKKVHGEESAGEAPVADVFDEVAEATPEAAPAAPSEEESADADQLKDGE